MLEKLERLRRKADKVRGKKPKEYDRLRIEIESLICKGQRANKIGTIDIEQLAGPEVDPKPRKRRKHGKGK